MGLTQKANSLPDDLKRHFNDAMSEKWPLPPSEAVEYICNHFNPYLNELGQLECIILKGGFMNEKLDQDIQQGKKPFQPQVELKREYFTRDGVVRIDGEDSVYVSVNTKVYSPNQLAYQPSTKSATIKPLTYSNIDSTINKLLEEEKK